MASYQIHNTQSINNLTSIFINAGNTSRSFKKNNNENIGSKVVINNNVNKIKPLNVFSFNNQRPILYKLSYGNLSINNYAKKVRSLLGFVYYLCPQNYTNTTFKCGHQIETHTQSINQSNFCFQFGPPTQEPHFAPLIVGNNGFVQSGIIMNYRLKNDLYGDWNRTFVPQAYLISQNAITEDGTPFVFNRINLQNILPNGDYIIEYSQF